MSGGNKYLLLAKDTAKVGGTLSVVEVSHNFEHPKSIPYYFSILYISPPWLRTSKRFPGVAKSYVIMRRTPPGQVLGHQVSVWD